LVALAGRTKKLPVPMAKPFSAPVASSPLAMLLGPHCCVPVRSLQMPVRLSELNGAGRSRWKTA
jgi:hypothetical protein